MTDAEIRQRLAEYMESDITLMPRLVAVEVRLSGGTSSRCRYDVLLIDEEGGETSVKFRDRCSRLMYIYTLLHPLLQPTIIVSCVSSSLSSISPTVRLLSAPSRAQATISSSANT